MRTPQGPEPTPQPLQDLGPLAPQLAAGRRGGAKEAARLLDAVSKLSGVKADAKAAGKVLAGDAKAVAAAGRGQTPKSAGAEQVCPSASPRVFCLAVYLVLLNRIDFECSEHGPW